MRLALVLVLVLEASCGGVPGPTRDTTPVSTSLGEKHAGDYSLGPVAFSGSYWNSCAPYTSELQKRAGDNLAGLPLRFNGNGSLCDACILVMTAKGKSVMARVVTTGDTRGPNDIDLSQKAFDAINLGEYPRSMTWHLVKCSDNGAKIQYQFQTESNPYWTSLWVRNARLPLRSVEAKSKNHPTFIKLERGTDGTLTDAAGFGDGPFTLRLTAYDGQIITDSFPKLVTGSVLGSSSQFE
jgi:expansin (peptidoglycan-binding protein)